MSLSEGELAARAVALFCPGTLAERRLVLEMLDLTNPPTGGSETPRYYGSLGAEHGTAAGEKAHRRRGERPCDACTVAQRAYAQARRRLAGQQPRALRPIQHGTANGYRTHRRRGEDACQDCLIAARIYRRKRGQLNRAA